MKTTFIIPSICRDTLDRAVASVEKTGASHIIYHDDERAGAGHARAEMIKKVKTEWVSMLDDDDTVTDDYVKRLEEEIAANPWADLIHFREYFIADLMGDDVTEDHFIPRRPKVEWGNVGISFSVKTDVAKKIGFRSEPYEDYEFIKRVADAGYKIHFSKYIVYRGRH